MTAWAVILGREQEHSDDEETSEQLAIRASHDYEKRAGPNGVASPRLTGSTGAFGLRAKRPLLYEINSRIGIFHLTSATQLLFNRGTGRSRGPSV